MFESLESDQVSVSRLVFLNFVNFSTSVYLTHHFWNTNHFNHYLIESVDISRPSENYNTLCMREAEFISQRHKICVHGVHYLVKLCG